MTKSTPLTISVVTPVLNNRDSIEACVQSVQHQTQPSEHIVVDGGSTDGTLEWLRDAAQNAPDSHRLTVSSGPDKGLYDAMNQGLARATGDLVGFLNADDRYARTDALALIAEAIATSEADACYADLVYAAAAAEGSRGREAIARLWRSGPYRRRRFLFGWMPPHPTFYARREAYLSHGGLRLDLGSAADYECMLRLLYRHRLGAVHIPEVLVVMALGGVSNRSLGNRIRAHRMDYRAWRVNGLTPLPCTVPMKPLRKLAQWVHRRGVTLP